MGTRVSLPSLLRYLSAFSFKNINTGSAAKGFCKPRREHSSRTQLPAWFRGNDTAFHVAANPQHEQIPVYEAARRPVNRPVPLPVPVRSHKVIKEFRTKICVRVKAFRLTRLSNDTISIVAGVVELVSDFTVCKEGAPLSPEAARILVSRLTGFASFSLKLFDGRVDPAPHEPKSACFADSSEGRQSPNEFLVQDLSKLWGTKGWAGTFLSTASRAQAEVSRLLMSG